MLENAPLEPFSCSIPCRYVMHLLIEKRNVLTKTFLLPLKAISLPDTYVKLFEKNLFSSAL